jgi:hypothetical protein
MSRRWLARAIAVLLLAGPLGAAAQDSDGDGVPDATDNCDLVWNAPPYDCNTDLDAYGNACDGDFNNDGLVASADSELFGLDFASGTDGGTGTDMDCNGVVNANDFSVFYRPQNATGIPGP